MSHEHMLNFLQAVVVFLLMTNAVSAMVAMYAIWVANGFAHKKQELSDALGRKADAMLRRAT